MERKEVLERKEVVAWIKKKEEISQVYTYGQTYQFIIFKYLQFITCQLQLTKAVLKNIDQKGRTYGFF